MAVVSVTSQKNPNFGFKNEFVSTLMLAIVSALAYDFLKGVVTNQVLLIIIGVMLGLFFGENLIGKIGLGIAVIGIAKYIAKDTATVISDLNPS